MKKKEQIIINWIRKKVKETGAKGAVIGLSGGIDSSVVGALLVKALGREKVIGIIMPCESNPKDKDHALLVSFRRGIACIVIDLENTFKNLTNILPPGNILASSNLKARLRMSTLYFFANLHNYLVIGTANKTELAVGYLTKYGDGGVDIEPIGDLYKKDVVKLAQYLGIPKEIINKPPSAGLWEGQTDEKEMGITYEELDNILYFRSWNYTKNHKKERKVEQMIKNSEHKRKPPEICKL